MKLEIGSWAVSCTLRRKNRILTKASLSMVDGKSKNLQFEWFLSMFLTLLLQRNHWNPLEMEWLNCSYSRWKCSTFWSLRGANIQWSILFNKIQAFICVNTTSPEKSMLLRMHNCTNTITLIETGQEGTPHLTQSLPFQSQNIYARKTLFFFLRTKPDERWKYSQYEG